MMNANRSEADISIRRLTPADAPAYRALRLRGLDEHPDAFTSSADAEAAQTAVGDRSADRAGQSGSGSSAPSSATRSPAWSGIAREPRAKNRHKAAVFGMYVAPDFGRRGIGRALLRHVVAAAEREAGLEQLVLTVTSSNDPARLLYESEGFRSFGIEPRAIRVGDVYFDKNHMVRFLAPA